MTPVAERIDERALLDLVSGRRWFGSKSRAVAGGRIVDAAVLRAVQPPLVCAILEVAFDLGESERYQLLLGFRPDGEPFDGLGDPELSRELIRPLRSSATIGALAFHGLEGLPAGLEGATVRPIGGEQSNSSVVYGDAAILKVYRRLEPGESVELELLRFLGERGFPNVPRLLGWYEHTRPRTTLGVLQAFVAGGRDGWELALEDLDGFLPLVRRLGEVTGRLHAVLASDRADPAFRPEQFDGRQLVGAIAGEVRDLFAALPEENESLDPIRGRGEELVERVRLGGDLGCAIRQHGDYHLGQVLRTVDDWFVLDFEGEPARTLAGRRRKRSPLRDVAGMLRSFSYAAETVRDPPPRWEERARADFLDGYLAAVDPELLPAGDRDREALLAAFELEKAVYELRYELNNRPDWARIPVAGIERLLGAAAWR